MFAALIKDAPTLALYDLADFKECASMKLTNKQWAQHKAAYPQSLKPKLRCFEYFGGHLNLPCVKFAFDFGEDWHCLLDFLHFQEVYFLVKGDLRMTYYEHIPQTSDLYPIPIAAGLQTTPIFVRGEIVLAILSREMNQIFLSGIHRIGDWVFDKAWLFYSPKDYVMEAHLQPMHYLDSDPGCVCCQTLDVGRRQFRISMEHDLHNAHVSISGLLELYGVERMARFFQLPGYMGHLTSRLMAVQAEIKWLGRRKLLCGLAVCVPAASFCTEITQRVLLDPRLLGLAACKPSIRSFIAGGILSFL